MPSADFAPVVVQVVECVPVGINVPGLDMLDCAPLGAMVLGALLPSVKHCRWPLILAALTPRGKHFSLFRKLVE